MPPNQDATPDRVSPAQPDLPARLSLTEGQDRVQVPGSGPRWRQWLAVAGPALLVSVGYMDPGNWATDLAGGSRYAYRLLWVLLVSNLMAILLQSLAARLGLVRGRDLAQASRETYPPLREPGPLPAGRGGHRSHRPGGGDRLRHRPEPAVRAAAAGRGGAHHPGRAAPAPAHPVRHPQAGSGDPQPGGHHRRRLRGGAVPGQAGAGADPARVPARACRTPTPCTSPSASSGPR